jgi:TonB family protein
MTQVMQAIDKQKWKDLRGCIHPFTLKAMEERKQRTKKDSHNLSFWNSVKEYRIRRWELTSIEPGPRSTAVVVTTEDHFLVEEKGMEEGKTVEWLLVRGSGRENSSPRWWILDRRNGTGNFVGPSIEKGFADALPADSPGADDVPTLTPLAAYQMAVERAVRTKLHIPDDIPESQLKVMKATAKIMIDEGGGVLSRVISRASGNPVFDKALIKAIDAAQPLPAPENALVAPAKTGIEVEVRGKP